MKVTDAIRYIIDSTENIYNPGESESIAFIVLEFIGFSRKKLVLNASDILDKSQEDFIYRVADELKHSKPVQYILGETEFFGLRFKLNASVLIPRQETEELVDMIIRENKKSNPVILDLGTGSGCIAVALAKKIGSAKVFASDISKEALQLAAENAGMNHVGISWILDDILNSTLDKSLVCDILVSNPPYVRDMEKQFMHKNVLSYEPELALFVLDSDPLLFYRAIAGIALEKLKHGGLLYVEINENFGTEVAGYFKSGGLANVKVIQDIRGKDRFVKALKV